MRLLGETIPELPPNGQDQLRGRRRRREPRDFLGRGRERAVTNHLLQSNPNQRASSCGRVARAPLPDSDPAPEPAPLLRAPDGVPPQPGQGPCRLGETGPDPNLPKLEHSWNPV